MGSLTFTANHVSLYFQHLLVCENNKPHQMKSLLSSFATRSEVTFVSKTTENVIFLPSVVEKALSTFKMAYKVKHSPSGTLFT